jgi:hypothetical protein
MDECGNMQQRSIKDGDVPSRRRRGGVELQILACPDGAAPFDC